MLVAVARATESRGGDVLVERVGGGVAIYAGVDSPYTKLAGLGFEPLDIEALAAIERAFDLRGSKLQIEFSSLGDGPICCALTGRGYQLTGFENVMGRTVERGAPLSRCGIDVTLAEAGETEVWIDALVTGFEHPDVVDGPSLHESFSRETIDRALRGIREVSGLRRYLARLDGVVAGGGSMFIAGRVALLCGAATLPACRRRGVQTALLRRRLEDAAAAECNMAVLTIAQPGSKSQENARRQGFELLYTRAVLARKPSSNHLR